MCTPPPPLPTFFFFLNFCYFAFNFTSPLPCTLEDIFDEIFSSEQFCVPMAPPDGLLLDRCIFSASLPTSTEIKNPGVSSSLIKDSLHALFPAEIPTGVALKVKKAREDLEGAYEASSKTRSLFLKQQILENIIYREVYVVCTKGKPMLCGCIFS